MAGGRPTKLNPDVRERIIQAVSVGVPLDLAAGSAGISGQTLRNWVKKGEDEEAGEFYDFALALKEAEGRALVKWLAIIDRAAQDGNWSAAAWKAERRYPQHFGRQRLEVTGKDGGPIEGSVQTQVAFISDPERQAKILKILSDAGVVDLPSQRAPRPDAGRK